MDECNCNSTETQAGDLPPRPTLCEALTWLAWGEALPRDHPRVKSDDAMAELYSAWNFLLGPISEGRVVVVARQVIKFKRSGNLETVSLDWFSERPSPEALYLFDEVQAAPGTPAPRKLWADVRFQRAEIALLKQIALVKQYDAAAPESGHTVVQLPPKRRGPKGGLTKTIAQEMATNIKGGKTTLHALHNQKQETLASTYGAKSRATVMKALKLAQEIVANPVGISGK